MHDVKTERRVREAGIAPLTIVIPHVELDLTVIALREAARLGRDLETRVKVLAIRTVPYPASLDPSSHPDYFRELIALAEKKFDVLITLDEYPPSTEPKRPEYRCLDYRYIFKRSR